MTPAEARKAKRATAKATRIAAGSRIPPRAWLRQRIEPCVIAGESDETIARRFAQLFDALLDFDRTVPPPFGALIEALDGEVYYVIALPIVRRVRAALVKSGKAAQ